MPSHRYWQALAMTAPTPATLELSEFHLYNGATRVDAAATLTASAAPSGAVANLKDNNTGTGSYWATGGDVVVLSWAFPAAQNVTGIALGSRTTQSRFPTSLVLRGGDVTTGAGPNPEYTSYLFFGARWASATLSAVLTPVSGIPGARPVTKTRDLYLCPGTGRVPFTVKREILPRTTPRTFVPQWARVQLCRFIDGRPMRETWSDPVTGLGAFENVDQNLLYTVVAISPDTGKRAVIADRVKPEGYPT